MSCNVLQLLLVQSLPSIQIPLDDSADGGTIYFTFDSPKKVASFDFVDGDRPGATAFATAFSDVGCTSPITTVPIDMTAGDGSVQTVTLNANNTLCLKIHFEDSGGITNLHFECPDNILGKGQIDLPNGYDSSDTLSIEIPDEDMAEVGWVTGVKILIQTVILDFTGLSHGDSLSDQYVDDYGIWIEGKLCTSSSCSTLQDIDLQVYNTDLNGGEDPDLEVGVGNISVIRNGFPDLPANDSPHGGEQIFIFHTPRHVNSILFVDADRGDNGGTIGHVTTYDNTDCEDDPGDPTKNEISSNPIISLGDGSTQILVTMNDDKVSCLKADYRDSGGLSSINLGCPLLTDPVQ